MKSIGAQVRTIAGLAGTNDVDDRTSQFITRVVEQTGNGNQTASLSEKQIDWIGDIHKKHFGAIT